MMKVSVGSIPQMGFLAKLMSVMLRLKETVEAQKAWAELGKQEASACIFAQKQHD